MERRRLLSTRQVLPPFEVTPLVRQEAGGDDHPHSGGNVAVLREQPDQSRAKFRNVLGLQSFSPYGCCRSAGRHPVAFADCIDDGSMLAQYRTRPSRRLRWDELKFGEFTLLFDFLPDQPNGLSGGRHLNVVTPFDPAPGRRRRCLLEPVESRDQPSLHGPGDRWCRRRRHPTALIHDKVMPAFA
jgi:hypothetical protein